MDRLALTVESNAANITELSQTQRRMMQEFSEYRRDMLETRADIREMANTQPEFGLSRTQVIYVKASEKVERLATTIIITAGTVTLLAPVLQSIAPTI